MTFLFGLLFSLSVGNDQGIDVGSITPTDSQGGVQIVMVYFGRINLAFNFSNYRYLIHLSGITFIFKAPLSYVIRSRVQRF
jgi:hypothetical protein